MKRYAIILATYCIIVSIVLVQSWVISRLKEQRDTYRRNEETLLTDVEHYRTQDSLNVARVQVLELSLHEFKKYREDDARLIKTLRNKLRDVQSVTNANSTTTIDVNTIPRDTIVIRDSVRLNAKYVHYSDAWTDVKGVVTDTTFRATIQSYDSLTIVERVKYKRFLGFLWRTKKVKSRTTELVNRNPHTTITDVESILITK